MLFLCLTSRLANASYSLPIASTTSKSTTCTTMSPLLSPSSTAARLASLVLLPKLPNIQRQTAHIITPSHLHSLLADFLRHHVTAGVALLLLILFLPLLLPFSPPPYYPLILPSSPRPMLGDRNISFFSGHLAPNSRALRSRSAFAASPYLRHASCTQTLLSTDLILQVVSDQINQEILFINTIFRSTLPWLAADKRSYLACTRMMCAQSLGLYFFLPMAAGARSSTSTPPLLIHSLAFDDSAT